MRTLATPGDKVDLTGVQSFAQVLSRTQNGRAIIGMLRNLGLWSRSEQTGQGYKDFPANTSQVQTSTELGDASLYWQSELSKVVEMLGILEAERVEAEVYCKRARNQARAAAIREGRSSEPRREYKQFELKDLAESDERVVEADNYKLMLDKLIAAFEGLRVSYEGKTRALSREQTRRDNELASFRG